MLGGITRGMLEHDRKKHKEKPKDCNPHFLNSADDSKVWMTVKVHHLAFAYWIYTVQLIQLIKRIADKPPNVLIAPTMHIYIPQASINTIQDHIAFSDKHVVPITSLTYC